MSAAQRYEKRSARYVFRTSDQTLMRFADMDARGVSHHATVRDLSETGLAFTFGREEKPTSFPDEGDLLKIEFNVPGRKSIACFATVVRVEHVNDWDPDWGDRGFTKVALHFRNLPTLHLRTIQLGLKGKVGKELDFDWSQERRRHAFAFAAMTLALALVLFAMATPLSAWIKPFAVSKSATVLK